MSNDLDLYGAGDLAPYSPSQPLAPASAPDWNAPTDLLPVSHHSPNHGQPLIFGQYPLPPGITLEQVTAAYQQLGSGFVGDMMRLHHNLTHSQLAVKWFMDSMTRTPAREPQRHRYNLYEHVNDPVFQSFANYASDCGFSQKLITDACWWVSECGRKLNQNSSSQTPRTEPLQSKDPTDSLTDAQFEQVVRINQQAAMNTEITLRRKWGDSSYLQNIQVAQRYLDSLPPKEREHFEQFTSGWIRALNTAEVIEGLFNMAIGAANIPTSGGSVQAEISQIEGLMRDPVSRRAYLKDAELQARLRFLYTMRDDG